MWEKVISLAKAIYERCEDAHVNSNGKSFYSSHEMFAEIQDAVKDLPDEVYEVYYGARNLPFPASKQIIAREGVLLNALMDTTDVHVMAEEILMMLKELIGILTEITEDKDCSLGENDLAASTAKDIQKKIYFLNRYLLGA